MLKLGANILTFGRHYYLGKVQRVEGDTICLTNASLVGDSGPLDRCLKDGALFDYTKLPQNVYLSTHGLVWFDWLHDLPS